MYFVPLLKGFPLELGIDAGGQKTRMIGLPGRTKSLMISSAVWIQSTNVTDGWTDTGQQQRPRLRIAWHGKKITMTTLYAGWRANINLIYHA